MPLAGVPVRAVSEYLRRLVQQGFRVAICEQVEDPKLAKGIVRRAVVETVTPGAAFSDDLLDGTRNNFLCAVQVAGGIAGDRRCRRLHGRDSPGRYALGRHGLTATLARLSPREMLVPSTATTRRTWFAGSTFY